MRKSSAPSQKQFVAPKISSSFGPNNSVSSGARSTDSILGLINKQTSLKATLTRKDPSNVSLKKENQRPVVTEGEPAQESLPSSSSLRCFNVVYGKQSTKKHKTWEGDGILEVGLKKATLKDLNGKILGQGSCKPETLEEGSRLFVGSKEVELVDEIHSPVTYSTKRPNEDDDDPPDSPKNESILKKKKTKSNPTSYGLNTLNISSLFKPTQKFSVNKNYEELIMPRPDDKHQWEMNVDHLPVTDVAVDGHLCRVLKPHQREGVTFLYRCVTGLRDVEYQGAILADEMGLGKTLQCISLIWTMYKQGPYGGKPLIKRTLIVVPSSLVQNWCNEFTRWLGSHRMTIFCVNQKNKVSEYKKYPHIPVLVVSYEMLVRSFDDIQTLSFDLIICDEGHRLKNTTIRSWTLLNSLECPRRILLTGTPIQNDLQEFYALVHFVNPGILDTPSSFKKKFADAIIASKEPDAPIEIIEKGKELAEELNRLTSPFILRRTQSGLQSCLPIKHEYVVFCECSPLQKKMYRAASNYWLEVLEQGVNSRESLVHLSVLLDLRKICNGPSLVVKPADSETDNESLPCILQQILNEHGPILLGDSTKLTLVACLLAHLYTDSVKRERVVLVSNFTQTLDVLEKLCANKKYPYLRLDGSTPGSSRDNIVQQFNSPSSNSFVLLLSAKAGGVGLNLIGGSRLVLYDSDWNPATDLQAMARIWRQGQTRPVHIYRLLTAGTIEEKIYQRQLSKTGLGESVVDPDCGSSVKLSDQELKDVFSFTNDTQCGTHELLHCDCSADGCIPEGDQPASVDQDKVRDCELNLGSDPSSNSSSLRINQLFSWEHHSSPFSPEILQDMGLTSVQDSLIFMFRNKSS